MVVCIFKSDIKHGNIKTKKASSFLRRLVLEAGLEPARPKEHRILSPACLPIPPLELGIYFTGASEGIRTLDPHLGKVMLYP